jgi:hypothetical protein
MLEEEIRKAGANAKALISDVLHEGAAELPHSMRGEIIDLLERLELDFSELLPPE